MASFELEPTSVIDTVAPPQDVNAPEHLPAGVRRGEVFEIIIGNDVTPMNTDKDRLPEEVLGTPFLD